MDTYAWSCMQKKHVQEAMLFDPCDLGLPETWIAKPPLICWLCLLVKVKYHLSQETETQVE